MTELQPKQKPDSIDPELWRRLQAEAKIALSRLASICVCELCAFWGNWRRGILFQAPGGSRSRGNDSQSRAANWRSRTNGVAAADRSREKLNQ